MFVALVPPIGVREDITRAVTAAMTIEPAAIRPTPPEKLHLTLSFLGALTPVQRDEIIAVLTAVAPLTPPLALRCVGSGEFSNRVLWLGIEGATTALGQLAGSVTDAARAAGIDIADRPFRAHLTVGRSRHSVPAGVVEMLSSYESPPWTANELLLMNSDGHSPAYEIVARAPLTG